jgi:integrase
VFAICASCLVEHYQLRGQYQLYLCNLSIGFSPLGQKTSYAGAYDADAGTLRLWRHTKTNEERYCGVDAGARLALMQYLKRERKEAPGPLFVQRQKQPMSANAITCVIRSLAESAGVQCSAHDFRRACAARMLAAGAQPDVVQYQLGHRTATLTMQYGKEARRQRSLQEYHALDQGVRPLRRAI